VLGKFTRTPTRGVRRMAAWPGLFAAYMLVDGQGNFGSVDGDPPAAMPVYRSAAGATAEELLLESTKTRAVRR